MMRVALIGTGNVATSLAPALISAGHEVVQFRGHDVVTLCEEPEVYIVAVKDDAIVKVAKALPVAEGSVVVHTAGSVPMFDGMEHCGVLYPMQTFSKARPVDMRMVPCFVEGNDDYSRKMIRSLACSISDHVYDMTSDDRRYLHLAAVFACNFVNHCYTLASDVLTAKGIPFDVLLPLIDETAAKVHDLSPENAQTGPVKRYDLNIIDKHLKMLHTGLNAEIYELNAEIYELMSKSIHEHDKSQGDKSRGDKSRE